MLCKLILLDLEEILEGLLLTFLDLGKEVIQGDDSG